MACGVCSQGTRRGPAWPSPAGVCPECGRAAPTDLARVVRHWNRRSAGPLPAGAAARFCAAAALAAPEDAVAPTPAVLVWLLGSGAVWDDLGVTTTELWPACVRTWTRHRWEAVQRVVCRSVATAAANPAVPAAGWNRFAVEMEHLLRALESLHFPVQALATAIVRAACGGFWFSSVHWCDPVLVRAERRALIEFRESSNALLPFGNIAHLRRCRVEAAAGALEWAPPRREWVAAVARGVRRRAARARAPCRPTKKAARQGTPAGDN